MKKGTVNASLILFEGGVSLAEILSGSYFGNLGFQKGFLAIVLGRFIGAVVIFFAGMVGVKTKKTSMEIARSYFGDYGCYLFVGFNIIQLLGWSAFMTYDAAVAANTILPVGYLFWVLLVSAVVALLIIIGLKDTEWLNRTAALALFCLTIILSFVIFKQKPMAAIEGTATFTSAIEVTVAMTLSWLPILNDYTAGNVEDEKGMLILAAVNFVVGIWMSCIGLGSVVFCGTSNLALILGKAGLGLLAVVILVLSTGTVSYIDANSAGLSFLSIKKDADPKIAGLIILGISIIAALTLNLESMESFLELMSSFFSPALGIEIGRCLFIKEFPERKKADLPFLFIWLLGVISYLFFHKINTIVGASFLSIVAAMGLTLLYSGRNIR